MWMLCQDTQAIPAEDRGDIPSYCGPKEIGQIFGISYIYSMFFRFGLIRVPKEGSREAVERLRQVTCAHLRRSNKSCLIG